MNGGQGLKPEGTHYAEAAANGQAKAAPLDGDPRFNEVRGTYVFNELSRATQEYADAAVLAERERCAKIAEELDGRVFASDDLGNSYNEGYLDARKEIAAKIREGK